MANCPPLADRMLYRHHLTALNPARFHKISGGGLLSSVRWLGEFRPRLPLHLHGIEPPSPIIRSCSPTIPQVATVATATSLLSSPLMIVPPLSTAEEDDDYNDYFHFLSVAPEQKKLRVKKVGRRWQREYLTPDNAVCVGSSHGWLVFVHPRNSNLYLSNPFSNHNFPYIPLPSLETAGLVMGLRVMKSSLLTASPSLTRHFLMLNWQASEYHALPSDMVVFHAIRDVVLSSSPSLDNCTVVMNYQGRLYFCKVGDLTWTPLGMSSICDLTYFSKDGRFYALGEKGYYQLQAWDLRDHSCPKHAVINPTFSGLCQRTILEMADYMSSEKPRFVKYLVDSSGDLLLVFRFFTLESVFPEEEEEEEQQLEGYFVEKQSKLFSRTFRFVVHKLNFNLNEWEYVECLNDCALFVGYNHSYSLSTRDFPELRDNSIYFTENFEELVLGTNTGHDNGVYHLEDNSITFYRTRDWKHIKPESLSVPSPVWVAKNAL